MRFIHLAAESLRRTIERAGIHGSARDVIVDGGTLHLPRAVFCMPVLRDYSTTYQWLRELRDNHGERMVAVHLRVPDDEPVWVGRFGAPHVAMTAAASVRWIQEQPLGAEVVIPRAIARTEVRRIAELPQLVGWTKSPEAAREPSCICPACLRIGTPRFMNRVRGAWMKGITELRRAQSDRDVLQALGSLEMPLERARGRIDPGRVLSLARHDSPSVRAALARLLGQVRFEQCEAELRALAEDPDEQVRSEAVRAVLSVLGPRRAGELLGGMGPATLIHLPAALEGHGDYDAVKPVLRALGEHPDASVRAEALRAAESVTEDERP